MKHLLTMMIILIVSTQQGFLLCLLSSAHKDRKTNLIIVVVALQDYKLEPLSTGSLVAREAFLSGKYHMISFTSLSGKQQLVMHIIWEHHLSTRTHEHSRTVRGQPWLQKESSSFFQAFMSSIRTYALLHFRSCFSRAFRWDNTNAGEF